MINVLHESYDYNNLSNCYIIYEENSMNNMHYALGKNFKILVYDVREGQQENEYDF